jgi:hypothetical protein
MVTKWTPFCPISGSPHNSNYIECLDCGAVNPRMSEAAPVPVPQARPSQPKEVVHVSDSPPKAITVSKFATYGASRRGQQSRRPEGPYKASVHFYTRYYEVDPDGLHRCGNCQHLGMYNKFELVIFTSNTNWCKIAAFSLRLPPFTVDSIDEFTETRLVPLLAEIPGFTPLPDDRVRVATKLARAVPVFLPPQADQKWHIYDLFSAWFPYSVQHTEWAITAIVQRKEPTDGPEAGEEPERKGRGGGRGGRGRGRGGRGRGGGGGGRKGKAKVKDLAEEEEEEEEFLKQDRGFGLEIDEPAGEEQDEDLVEPAALIAMASRKRSLSNLSSSTTQPRRSGRFV